MSKNFSIDARTLIHLGRESIKDHTTALLELVKNSYDADANVVEIEIYKKETQDLIRIADDGEGMTEKDIDDKWLRIGYSHKKNDKQTSKKNRRKTGEKGIGRLSADRLGEVLEIKTISEGNHPYGLKIDWELFNQDNLDLSKIELEEIQNPLLRLPTQKKQETGTEMLISKLRTDWTDENIQNLYTELSILTSPFKEVQDFEIYIKNDIAPDFNGKVEPSPQVHPEIEIELDYDGVSESIEYIIKDRFNSDKPLKSSSTWPQLMQKVIDPFDYPYSQALTCGPVKIKLLLYPRTKALAEGTKFTLTELREFVNKNIGIKIYRDNISVKPYGYLNVQYGGDWLGLAERHSRNPAGLDREDYRVVANQLVGAIFVGRDTNPDLTDSASREGLIENEAFYDLRALTLGALALLENRRYQIYQSKKVQEVVKPTPTESSDIFKNKIETAKKTIESLKEMSKSSIKAIEIAKNVEDFIKDAEQASVSFEELLKHTRVLAGLATLGIAAAVFGHETQNAITEFNAAAELANEYLEYSPEDLEIIRNELNKAIKFGNQVAAWGAFSLTRVQKEKRKKENKNVDQIISNIIGELEVILNNVSIELELKLDSIVAKAYPMDIESILVNILTNAYTACLQKPVGSRKIKIESYYEEHNNQKGFYLNIVNSGPPIDETLYEWIWEPLNTLKQDSKNRETGTGLGLTIVKSIVDDLKGSCTVTNNKTFGGAEFKIWFPLK
ncbi:ATP-binding protein [Sphingobacterium sp. R2]|uniref:ATP-binding protein n=1 Tax=Sphingobacterium sp. R2 TaxID=3112958 RepID=UPI00345D034F